MKKRCAAARRRSPALWPKVLDQGTATVRRASVYADGVGMMLGRPKTEGAKGRHHLSPVVVELLRRRRQAQLEERLSAGAAWQQHEYEGRPVDLVFTTNTGALLLRQKGTKAVRAAATKAGIDPEGLGTHAGRSTAITVLYSEEGLDLADVARHVGHASSATTAATCATSGGPDRDLRGGNEALRPHVAAVAPAAVAEGECDARRRELIGSL